MTMLGRKHTEETKRKMSEAAKGRVPWNKGKKLSLEIRQKLSQAQKNRSPESRRKMSERMQGDRNPQWGKRGELSPNWKGGQTTGIHGRIVIYVGFDHPMADNGGYCLRYRLVMSEMMGRYLLPGEVVHHINEDPTNDKEENLMLFPNNGKHTKHHAQLRRVVV